MFCIGGSNWAQNRGGQAGGSGGGGGACPISTCGSPQPGGVSIQVRNVMGGRSLRNGKGKGREGKGREVLYNDLTINH